MINNVIIQGRLTDTPETQTKDNSDTKYTRFTLACQRDSDKEISDFIDCVCFNKTSENLSKYMTKGEKVTVIGNLETSSYVDKNNIKRKGYSVRVSKIYFPDKRKNVPDDYSDIPIPEGDEGE